MLKTVQATMIAELDHHPANSMVSTLHDKLVIISSISALRNFEGEWRDLESNVQNHTSVFQSFDWIMSWSETYLQERPSISLHILAGYDDGKLVYLWPLMRTQHTGFSVLTWATEPFGQYGDVLCRKGYRAGRWIESSISYLKSLRNADVLRLRHVRADSHLAMHGQGFLVDAKVPEKAPYLDLTQFAAEADYDGRYTPVQRKRRKKIRKALEALGEVDFKRLPTGQLSDVAIDSAISEKCAWLSERGRINRILGCPLHPVFLKNLARRSEGNVQVIVSELTAGGKPVSWEVGFRHGRTHFGYITSHMNALTDLSPGRLHMDLSQRACLADGMAQFDLMVPNDAHKESWSSHAVDTNDFYVPLSMAGAAFGHVFIRTLRPLLRKLYYKATSKKFRLKALLQSKPSKAE
jgi:CelD/BcsL family acetyltransferase involved in cellulose biosynthesis